MYSVKLFDETSLRHQFSGLQQLISAALANPVLADALVADPAHALEQGLPEITLTHEEYLLITQVRDTTCFDHFAAYLYALVQDAILTEAPRNQAHQDTRTSPSTD
jgi:uncharacterized membrane protein YhhN